MVVEVAEPKELAVLLDQVVTVEVALLLLDQQVQLTQEAVAEAVNIMQVTAVMVEAEFASLDIQIVFQKQLLLVAQQLQLQVVIESTHLLVQAV
jgi:hypothetical protein